MHAVVLLCPYSDSQSPELLSSDTSNPQHKTAHPHHHCLSTPSLPMTARKMIHSIPGPYSNSIIPAWITASAANACGFLLTPKSKAPRRSTVASLGIVREALPILASGHSGAMYKFKPAPETPGPSLPRAARTISLVKIIDRIRRNSCEKQLQAVNELVTGR